MFSLKQSCPEYAAVAATPVLKEETMTKTTKKWKKSWQILDCKWRCIILERAKRKCQLEGDQTDLRLTAYSPKLMKSTTKCEHCLPTNICGRGKSRIYSTLAALPDPCNEPVPQCKSMFVRAVKTHEPKLDRISLQTPTEHSWKNGCEMIHTAPHISTKNTFQVI